MMPLHTKRAFDLVLASILLVLFAVPMAVIAILVRSTSRGPVLYWSRRVGRENAPFSMPKFRTMRVGAPVVATHLLTNPGRHITRIGRILRATSIDELPQLFSIIEGHMSFVGPRPALCNQDDLIALRTQQGVHELTPGLTGWAQINGRDELVIPKKVAYDAFYRTHQSFTFDLRILWRTCVVVFTRRGIQH
ncbi:MAG: sugar transferase [bacterium]|nr:sugar transferase [bacterium]